MKKYFTLVLSILIFGTAQAQSPYHLPGTVSDEIADRWDVLFDFDHEVFGSQRNTSRKELAERAAQIMGRENLSRRDKEDVKYILADNNEYLDFSGYYSATFESKKVYDTTGFFYYLESQESGDINTAANLEGSRNPILRYFYKTKANFFEVNNSNFSFKVNPILNLRYGKAIDDENIIFQNTRGLEMRGKIDNKIYFYTSLLENQQRFNNYLEDRIKRDRTLPGQGLYKTYNSTVIDNLRGYDFLNAQAYVGINATKSVAIEFGHGKHFIGNGIRSLLLSDYAHNYFYLKFNTRIWKFQYQNLFAELSPISSLQNPGDFVLPKKYMANHYLSFKPRKNMEIGIFEAIVFSRENHFEFQYLNPIILYRSVEQFLDSPDNVLIGLNAKWNIKNRVQLYGQLILDEFKIKELTSGTGWWANKYGIQAGAKVVNLFGIDHLDCQAEYNLVRPYTYSHRDGLEKFPDQATASYSHHNQPLAHPLGANFNEVVLNLRYRPIPKLFINARAIKAYYGQNYDGKNYGGNILLNNVSRINDFGNEIGQGVATNLQSAALDISYEFAHNYFVDLNLFYRNADAEIDELDQKTMYIGGGLRVNIGRVKFDY